MIEFGMGELNPGDREDTYQEVDPLDGDIIPSLDEAIDIFAGYDEDVEPLDIMGSDNKEAVNEIPRISGKESQREAPDHELADCPNPLSGDSEEIKGGNQEHNNNVIDAEGVHGHGGLNNLNSNLINACEHTVCGLGHGQFCKPTLNYRPLVPVIVECDNSSSCDPKELNRRTELGDDLQNYENTSRDDNNSSSANIAEVKHSSNASGKLGHCEKTFEEDGTIRGTDESLTSDTHGCLIESKDNEKLMKFLLTPISVPSQKRRHSISCTLANVRSAFIDTSVDVTNSGLNTDVDDITKNCNNSNMNNNSEDTFDAMAGRSKFESKESHSTPIAIPGTPRSSLSVPRGPRPRRYSLADISNMGLSVVHDNAFEKEIRQHQLLLNNLPIRHSISETSIPESDDAPEHERQTSSPQIADLTSPDQRADYLRRRRRSNGLIAPILPRLHLPRSPRDLTCERVSEDSSSSSAPAINIIAAPTTGDAITTSTLDEEGAHDDSTISNDESQRRLMAYRQNKRRSSWACTGVHTDIKPITTMQLLKESKYYDGTESPTTKFKDPYRLTVHFITDPGQSEQLKNLLRPLTRAIAPRLAIFNFAERSVNAFVPEENDEDHSKILALAIVVFIQEEVGAERLENAQGYLQKDPWALHHRSEVGPNTVPYPTNNQDYYAHADNMPLWAVRQVHFGKDRLRCQVFVSDQHWDSTIQLYTTILGHSVQYQKEDFCYFMLYANSVRNLEIQLSLKRLPIGYTPQPLEDVILQFKIEDIGSLVPLLPNVCSPISEKRWQTTDFDGNKILLLRAGDRSGKSTPRMDNGDPSVSPAVSSISSNGSDESNPTSDNERPRTRHKRGHHRRHHKQRTRLIATAV